MIPSAQSMRKIMIAGLSFFLSAVVGMRAAVAASNVFYFFDESPDSLRALDSSGEGFDFLYLGTSSQTTAIARFGAGSLTLGSGPLTGFGETVPPGAFEALGDRISRMTITLWVMPGIQKQDGAEVFFLQRLNGSTGQGRFTFNCSAIPKLQFSTDRGPDDPTNSTVYSSQIPAWSEGEWTHVAMTFDAGEVVFYLNGQPLDGPQSMPDGITSILPSTDPAVTVFRGMVSSPGIQYVDDFGFFGDEALPPDAIQAIYNHGLKTYRESKK